ncbi:lymphocyte antigen 6G isoform X1 [Poecilia formosa]|uniref:lymphocyte antigen 6G isoform X1 n=1 Tax=Poecilia formosa TaxID=48698 RepID=UPI0007BAD339|nr:PREDICTED: lymphocyte antigen 6D isoform X1 [Poecilia formosa]
MQLYGVLILFLSFSAASGLRCYTCVTSDPNACTNIETCPDGFDRCASVKIPGLITKTCIPSAGCISPIKCCDKDLCNGAVPTGPGVTLLLLSSALMMLFI